MLSNASNVYGFTFDFTVLIAITTKLLIVAAKMYPQLTH
jgi:hypothetical protein